MKVGDRVHGEADPRHVGVVKSVLRGGAADCATVRWEDTGWLSFRVPLRELRAAPRESPPHSECFLMKRAIAARSQWRGK